MGSIAQLMMLPLFAVDAAGGAKSDAAALKPQRKSSEQFHQRGILFWLFSVICKMTPGGQIIFVTIFHCGNEIIL
jgi:hypothetical protein